MRWFGGKAAREGARPALLRAGSVFSYGDGGAGAWPQGYEAQVREGYCRNPVAQRAVKLLSEAVAGAPLVASDPALLSLVGARSGGQSLLDTVAAQLLLHGNAYVLVLRDGEGRPAELFALRPERVAEDRLTVSRHGFLAGEAASVPLVEVREA